MTNLPKEPMYGTTDLCGIFQVDSRTIARWVEKGAFQRAGVSVFKTFGGHRRFLKSEVDAMYEKWMKGELNES